MGERSATAWAAATRPARLAKAPAAARVGRLAAAVLLAAAAACDLAPAAAPDARSAEKATVPPPAAAAPASPPAAAPAAAPAAPPVPPTSGLEGFVKLRVPAEVAKDPSANDAGAIPLPPPHEVPPASAEELRRKRAEWQEHLRMTEQAQADLESWRRSRRPAEDEKLPRLGITQRAKAAAEAERTAQAMRAWYKRYAPPAAAVNVALSQFGLASTASPPDARRLLAACRDLGTAARTLLADPETLAAPLVTVSRPLATAYEEIKAAAESCLAARPRDQAAHLAAAGQSMAEAVAAMRPFHLSP
jgi:hypothetical protein